MNKKILAWIIIGIMFLALMYLMYKNSTINIQQIQSAELAAKSTASTSGSGMVGGC